jgi:ATP-binding cassette subfamily B protein
MLLRFASRALARIEVLLDEVPLPEPDQPGLPQSHEIVFDDVYFAYEDAAPDAPPALAGVSCTLAANALTAVVGPSGAGKSTLVHLIARLWDVGSGGIRVGGVDLRDIGTDALQHRVAMVFQDVLLFSGSVLENLRIGRPEATREEVVEAARRAQAHGFISALPQGYDTPLDEGGASLSGGERQRISIARALLKDAPILLLDEATASIDPSAERDIQRAIAELAHGRRHCSSSEERAPCRSHSGPGCGPTRRTGHTPGVAGGRWPIRTAVAYAAASTGLAIDDARSDACA